ncbi:Gpi16 subunit, GPI transamidase component-domain-containing protein [Haematococcus lacustris]
MWRSYQLLIIALLLLCTKAEALYEYTEDALFQPLNSGVTLVQLQFQQRTVDCLDHGLFPVAINELARTFPVSTLELHLTRGRWDHLAWGVPPLEVQPPGARLLASWEGPEPAVQHSAHWTRLTHALSGVMCTALSLAADPAQAVSMWGPAGHWEAVLPQEPVCTDNLTPWLKLLPCGSKAGVAQLMSSRATIFSSYHHSLSLVLEVQRQPRPSGVQPSTSLLRLRHRLTLVLPSELVAPAGAVKAPGLLGLATLTRCRPASCSRLHLPAPSSPHSAQPTPATPTPAAAQDPATALCSRPDLPRGLNLTSLDLAAATGLPGQLPSLALAAWGPDACLPPRPAGLLFQLHAQGSGTLRGVLVWRVVRPDGGLLAPAGMQPPVVACIKQMLPWQIQLWLHTLQLTVDGQVIDSRGMQLRLQPAAHRTAPSALNLCFTLPANCTSLTLSAAFSKAFLTVSQQPPDAHRGVDVPAALLSLQAPDVDETQVVSTGVLVQLATPDISMGYNVICLSSTVMAVYVGAVLTALTKRMDQVQ